MMNEDKIILDLCGGTGAWSKPYKDAGYDVRNITLPEYNVLTYEPPESVYGILAAPPCTHFSFARTHAKEPLDLVGSMDVVIACLKIIWACQYKTESDYQQKPPLKFWSMENPRDRLEWFLGHPVFEFDPFQFGADYRKRTYLWGYFNKPIMPLVSMQLPFGSNYNTSGKFYGINDKEKQKELRSITPLGFANAFFKANQ